MKTRELGTLGEQAASQYLKGLGYEMLEYNYRTRYGEIDIIARSADTLVFVEVKTRRGRQAGTGSEAVTRRKQSTILGVALQYLQQRGLADPPMRFDVMEINRSPRGYEINHIMNAFGGDGF